MTAGGPVGDTWQVSFRYWGTARPRECFAWTASASADTGSRLTTAVNSPGAVNVTA
jgi:hypothetical protein